MEGLNKIIYEEDEQIVKKSAVNVINQFKRFFKTTDSGTQTFDPLIEGLQNEVLSKITVIEKLRDKIDDMQKE